MTDTGTETPRNLLPLPTQEEPLNDFLPSPSNTNESSSFWQALTGHPRVFLDISPFFDGNGKLTLPPSESQWETQESVLGQQPENLLHLSWLGVHDDLRIYVLTPNAMRTMKERLQSSGMQVSSLASDIGIAVERHIPSWKKESLPRRLIQQLIENPDKRKLQHVFFISADRLQTPMDTLALADEIRRLHPETAERLTLDLLLKLKVAQENADAWQRVLQSYPEGSVQDYLRQAFTDTQTYINRLREDLDQWIQVAQQRLGRNISDLQETLRQELQQRTFFFRSQSEETIRDTMKRIIERYHHLPQQEQQERTKTLVAYLLKKSLRETTRVAMQATEKLNQDPKQWLWKEVMIRGKERLLDTLPPSKGMIEYAQTHGIPPEHIRNVREWIRACNFQEQFQNLRRKLSEAQNIQLTKAQQQEYQLAERQIQQKIQEIQQRTKNKKRRILTTALSLLRERLIGEQLVDLMPHPVLANFSKINAVIQSVEDKQVKKKLLAVWKARRDLAKAQMDITNLFLQTTAKNIIPGNGYEGWNPEKGELQYLLETSPSFIAETGELNCAGRVTLMSSMLTETGVFSEEDIVVMRSYAHAFLGGFDALGIGRVIEPSGILSHSYFGIPRKPIFEDTVFDKSEIIAQYPLYDGLMTVTVENYKPYVHNKKIRSELSQWLLEKSNYRESLLWMTLLDDDSLDSLMSAVRACAINDRLENVFYGVLFHSFQDAQHFLSASINDANTAPLLSHLKLSLLAMKRTLDDKTKRESLKRRMQQELNIKNLNMNAIRRNLDQLLAILSNIKLPFSLPDDPRKWAHHIRKNPQRFGISKEDARSMSNKELVQRFLWNPDLFPKPIAIKDDGSVEWKMPEQT